MKELDYIKATNRVKVSAALAILRDVLHGVGDEYGISGNELSQIIRNLKMAENKLFASYEIKEDE